LVSFFNHVLNLSISEIFTKLFCNALDICCRYLTLQWPQICSENQEETKLMMYRNDDLHIFVLIKDMESFHELLFSVPFSYFSRHHVLKFIIVDCSTSILVHICYHLLNLLKWHRGLCIRERHIELWQRMVSQNPDNVVHHSLLFYNQIL